MSRTNIFNALRTVACPRPAIQAWRSARCFATEVSSGSSSASPIPIDATASSAITPSHFQSTISEFVNSSIIPTAASDVTGGEASKPNKSLVGVVVSAGKMQKTVKVRIPGQKWNKHLRKHFREDHDHLVHDPNSSLNIGDVVSLRPERNAKHVHHIVSQILVPFGAPISDRPPVPTEAERQAEYEEYRAQKVERRKLRRAAAQGSAKAIMQLKDMGLDAGQGAEAGVGEKNTKKAGLLGQKGQKLPKGVLPGGLHAVGKIGDRAKENKEKAMKRNKAAENNLLEAKEVAKELGQKS